MPVLPGELGGYWNDDQFGVVCWYGRVFEVLASLLVRLPPALEIQEGVAHGPEDTHGAARVA